MFLEKLDFSVAICALARDCAPALIKNIPRIEQLREIFQYSAVVIVENDSKDSTKELLNRWAKQSENVTIISQDFHTITIPPSTSSNLYPATSIYRIEKMAAYRNIYLDWVEQNNKKFDLVIMIDIDVESFFVKDILESIVFAPSNWGAIFANGYTNTKILGKEVYTMFHDMYAYTDSLPFSKPYFTYGKLFKLKKTMNNKLSLNTYLPVLSSFGGIGIYKFNAIVGLRYTAEENCDKYLEAICEHVMFNKRLIDRDYRAYICRDLKVYYGQSELLMLIRNILPLWLFKTLCLLIKFRKLKE